MDSAFRELTAALLGPELYLLWCREGDGWTAGCMGTAQGGWSRACRCGDDPGQLGNQQTLNSGRC